tara:strand:- start:6931 stop:7131 length:201 start_codon:yes stop_codon:yes gene_type:complete
MKAGDLVRYKSGTIWNAEDLFIVLKVSSHKKIWHRRIWLYNRHVDNGSIVVSWDEREIMEVISEAD